MTAATSEIIPVSDALELRAVEERYAADLHNLVVKNKTFLQTAFDWAQHVGSEEDTRRNVQSNQLLHQRGYAKMFLIFKSDELVGVLSFNTIEPANKAGYIGYWMKPTRGRAFSPGRCRRLCATTSNAGRSAVL
jgi:ribosomal-protein-serine acetyltransferase